MSKIQKFDYAVNLLRVIPWQYQGAVRLLEWLENKQANLDEDHTVFWESWFDEVFNIENLSEFGVTIWSIILEIPGIIETENRSPNISWGFGPNRKNYNNGNFNPSESQPALILEQKRIIIKMRYQKIVSRGTVPEINRIMNEAWGDVGNSYCIDNYDMTIQYVFEFPPQGWMLYAIETLDILPRPASVGSSIVDVSSWVLDTGNWDDNAVWKDSSLWNDGV